LTKDAGTGKTGSSLYSYEGLLNPYKSTNDFLHEDFIAVCL